MMMDIYIAPAIHAIVACSVRTGLRNRREQEIQYKQTNKHTDKQTNKQTKQTTKPNKRTNKYIQIILPPLYHRLTALLRFPYLFILFTLCITHSNKSPCPNLTLIILPVVHALHYPCNYPNPNIQNTHKRRLTTCLTEPRCPCLPP